jgi:hypothetical protein
MTIGPFAGRAAFTRVVRKNIAGRADLGNSFQRRRTVVNTITGALAG